MKYLITVILFISSFALQARDITGTWVSDSGSAYAEFTDDTLEITVAKSGRGFGSSIESELSGQKIPYELFQGGEAVILKTKEGVFILDIRELSKDRLVLSAGPVGFIYKRSGGTDIATLKADAKKLAVDKAIINNLRQVASGGMQYILEEGVESVKYDQLEGEYFPPIKPVNGEDYTGIIISEEGGDIKVTDKDGKVHTFRF